MTDEEGNGITNVIPKGLSEASTKIPTTAVIVSFLFP
jgi:hypothetical protein